MTHKYEKRLRKLEEQVKALKKPKLQKIVFNPTLLSIGKGLNKVK